MKLRDVLGGWRERVQRARLVLHTITDLTAPPARMFGSFGAGSVIVPPARVEHPEHMYIGAGVVIHEHAWLIAAPDGDTTPLLRIGDRSRFSRFVRIECHGSIDIGPGVLMADRSLVCDVEPLPRDPARPDEDRHTEPRPVRIEAGAFIGAGAVIKPGVTVGEHAYVSASSVVVDDVPPRTLVTGAPARAIKQWEPPTGA